MSYKNYCHISQGPVKLIKNFIQIALYFPHRVWTSSRCTRPGTRPIWRRSYLAGTPSPVAPTPPCTHRDHGPSDRYTDLTGTLVPRARRFPLPDGPGQVKVPVGQVDLNRFFLFISYKQIEEFQNSWSQASDDFEKRQGLVPLLLERRTFNWAARGPRNI